MAYERLRRQMQSQYGASNQSVTTKDEATLKNQALQALINVEVLKQASTSQSFQISNQQIDQYLQSMSEFQVDGRFSVERFQELLSSTLLTTNEFLDLIKTTLLIDQPKLGIIFTSFSVPEETNYTIALVNQSRDIEYTSIPISYFSLQQIVIPPEKVKRYYDEHQKDFMTPEQVNIDYIELSIKELAKKINPTENVLKNFYNENINSYMQPTTWKLADIEVSVPNNASQEEITKAQNKASAVIMALKNGESFSKMAHVYSHNFTAQDWMTLNQVPAELQKSVADLTKRGQLSDPIRTSKGFVIIKVVDMKEPQIQVFEKVKDKVKKIYVRQHAEEKFAELRDQLANITYERPDLLQPAAKTLGLPIQTSDLFSKDKSGKDNITRNKKIRDAAFSNDVLNLQNNSDVIQLNSESAIVLRVKSHIASTLLSFKDIYKQIEDKLKADEIEARTAKLANDLKMKLDSGEDAIHLANTYRLTWNKTGYIGRYSTKVDPAILDAAFRLPHPDVLKRKVTYGVAKLPSGGYAVVGLRAVLDGIVTDQKQYEVFAEQVQNSEGALEYQLYKQSQMNDAKIKLQ